VNIYENKGKRHSPRMIWIECEITLHGAQIVVHVRPVKKNVKGKDTIPE
jgi:hypothetical protein